MPHTTNLLEMSTKEFSRFLKSNHIKRFYFVYDFDTKKVSASHSVLDPIADFIEKDKRDFNAHEGLFFELDDQTDTILGASVHNTRRGQAAGGVRYWRYKNIEDYIRDGLRLAEGMTRKNALAGLWWGGGKGVMAQDPDVDLHDPEIRPALYEKYGRFMTSLEGCYITAEDVGTSVEDMDRIFSQTRFTTCIPFNKGGSGNPSAPTARGVIAGMEAGLAFLGMGDLQGKIVAVQGTGHVGEPLIQFLFEKGAQKVIACDVNADHVNQVKELFAGKNLEVSLINSHDLSFYETECDIFAPCATGAILNPTTIPLLKAKIVCGAANNQLEDAERDDRALFNKDIVYIPDFLTNRMGIVNCANEQYGYVENDEMILRHYEKDWEHSIYQAAMRVLEDSKRSGELPAQVAIRHADRLARELHPIFGQRGYQTIKSLVAKKWEMK